MTTDNKTLAVDVLAVMLDDAQKAKRHRMTVDAEYADDAEEESEAARAAVAELIAADEEYNRAREAWLASPGKHDEFQATRDAWKRRMKALVRVKGEAA